MLSGNHGCCLHSEMISHRIKHCLCHNIVDQYYSSAVQICQLLKCPNYTEDVAVPTKGRFSARSFSELTVVVSVASRPCLYL